MAKDIAIQSFMHMAIDDIFQNAGVHGRVNNAKALVKLGIYPSSALEVGKERDPRVTKALLSAINAGISNNDYTRLFTLLQKVDSFDQCKTTAFQDKYNEIWPDAGGKTRSMLSVGEKALAMQGLRLSAKRGKSDIDKVLESGGEKELLNMWQLLSGLAYTHKLHKEVGPSVNYLEMMQKTLLKEYVEKGSDGICILKDNYAGVRSSLGDYGIDSGDLLECINGSRVQQKLDYYGELDSEVQYDMSKIKKTDLTNVGMRSVKRAAMQVHSVIAKPYFLAKLGLSAIDYLESYDEPNPDIDPFLSFYRGESKDDVIGDNGRWTKYVTMVQKAFDEKTISQHFNKTNFEWNDWIAKDNLNNPIYNIDDIKIKFVELLVEQGAMAAETEREFAFIATKVMSSPEITNMFDPAKVYGSQHVLRGLPGSQEHVKYTDRNGNERNMNCVTARVITEDNSYTVQQIHIDHTTGAKVIDSYGIDAAEIEQTTGKIIGVNTEKNVLESVKNTYQDANLNNATIVVGTNPAAEIFQSVFEQERIQEQDNDESNRFQGVLLVKDLQVYKAAFQTYSAAVQQFI